MYVPTRERKEIKIPRRELKVEFQNESEEILKSDIKNNFFKNYIENKEFQKIFSDISFSQVNRFYSQLEDRNFYKDSKYIKEFIDKQLEREKNTDNLSLSKSKEFYSYYKENFLKDENISNSKINKIYVSLLKTYFRYMIGVKVFNEKLRETKEDE